VHELAKTMRRPVRLISSDVSRFAVDPGGVLREDVREAFDQ
jgi:hypothetical protein